MNSKEMRSKSRHTYWWRENNGSGCDNAAPKPGQRCPYCGQGDLAYDNLFLLACPACGKVAEGGAFT